MERSLQVEIEDYTPVLEETDVNDLVNFMVELFCVKSGVQND